MKTMKRINKEGRKEGRKKRKKQRQQEMKKMNAAFIIHASTLFFVLFFLGAAPFSPQPPSIFEIFGVAVLDASAKKCFSCLDRFLDPSVSTGSRWMHAPHACNELPAELFFCRFRCFCSFFRAFASSVSSPSTLATWQHMATPMARLWLCVYVALVLTLCLSLCAIHTNPVSCCNSHWNSLK